MAYDITLEYDVLISPFIKSKTGYNERKHKPGLYGNAYNEGISIYVEQTK